MGEQVSVRGPSRWLVNGAAFVVLVAGLKAGRPLFVPLVLAVFFALMGMPAVTFLRRKGLPDWAAVTLVVLGVGLLMTGLAAALGVSASGFVKALPKYKARLADSTASLQAWLAARGLALEWHALGRSVSPGAVMGLVGGTVKGLAAALSNLVLVFLTVIFILAEAAGMPAKLRSAFGDVSHFDHMAEDVQRYLAYKTWISLATGLCLGLWVWILGVDFPLLWGILAFLLNYVPNIGSIVAAVPPVLLALVQFGLGRALAVAGGYLAVNMVIGNVVEPMVLGRKLGLSSLVVFLSLVFWGWLWGPVGMLLSVPLTMVVKLALEHSENYRWVAVLLDSRVPAARSGSKSESPGGDGSEEAD